ncbi:hypothetical protein TRIHO_35960 [Tritonibacter horizontis]|uniref:Uncharacterized protein n=1 Tax=Tritonibacter horizontis TaxID=1768241 RepID=A0A132BSV3_9RHOB|nr:hypothetical protein TRIHO_35960 [Tritonibacter horizontis]
MMADIVLFKGQPPAAGGDEAPARGGGGGLSGRQAVRADGTHILGGLA